MIDRVNSETRIARMPGSKPSRRHKIPSP
jgi:hypothetical protein